MAEELNQKIKVKINETIEVIKLKVINSLSLLKLNFSLIKLKINQQIEKSYKIFYFKI